MPSGRAWPWAAADISPASTRPSAASAKKAKRTARSGTGTSTCRSSEDLPSLARMLSTRKSRAGSTTTAFYRSHRSPAWRINEHLARWAMQQQQRLWSTPGAMARPRRSIQYKPRLFAHWQLVAFNLKAGWWGRGITETVTSGRESGGGWRPTGAWLVRTARKQSLCGLGFGADERGDSWVMAQLVQAPAAVRPDAADRDAQPGADLGVRHGWIFDQQGDQLLVTA